MCAAWLRSRAGPGCVRSLSYDPVKFGQECGRANLLLLSLKSHVRSLQCPHQNRSERFFTISENLLKASSKYMWNILEDLCAHARNL